MGVLLAIITYFAYVFIVTMYTIKVVKFLKLPVHIRWDLYPVIHEPNYRYGGSYFEEPEWWTKSRKRHRLRGFLYLLKDNFYLGDYYVRNRSYWLSLYPWHAGFILIIGFHIFCFLAAVTMALGLDVAASSASAFGRGAYYVILVTGVASFILGAFGSIGLFIQRLTDAGLRMYATFLNYFNYGFFLVVFLSGLYSWYFEDPTFAEYREYWKSLVTLHVPVVEAASAVHILFFALFLIYLPYTKSMHYISRFLAFFRIRWDDEPNVRGGEMEKRLQKLLSQKVTWGAPHIQSGSTWARVATEVPESGKGEAKK